MKKGSGFWPTNPLPGSSRLLGVLSRDLFSRRFGAKVNALLGDFRQFFCRPRRYFTWYILQITAGDRTVIVVENELVNLLANTSATYLHLQKTIIIYMTAG
jgi:hypothetical protein